MDRSMSHIVKGYRGEYRIFGGRGFDSLGYRGRCLHVDLRRKGKFERKREVGK